MMVFLGYLFLDKGRYEVVEFTDPVGWRSSSTWTLAAEGWQVCGVLVSVRHTDSVDVRQVLHDSVL